MKYIFLSLLLAVFGSSFGQTGGISGKILADDLEGFSVKVLIEEIDKNTVAKNKTFEFINIPVGEYTLKTSALGYESVSKKVQVISDQTLKVNIRLVPNKNTLDEVVIIDRQTGLNAKTPYNFTSVRMDRIEGKSHPSGLMGILREVPGVYGAEFGQGIVKPFIRGLGFSRVVTIYQGNKLENQQWGADHGLGVNDLGVKDIDIIKGPASVLYGSGALGGVILVKDDEFYKDADDLSGNIGISYNSVSRGVRAFTSAGQRFENDWFFGIDLAYEDHADYRSGDGDIIGNSRYNMTTGRLHLGIDKEDFDNKLSLTFNHQNLGIISDDELEDSNATSRNDRDMQLPYQEVTDVLVSYDQSIDHGKFESVFHISHHFNDRKEIETADDLIDLGFKQHNTFYNARINFDTGKFTHNIGLQGNFLNNKNQDDVLDILIPDANYAENGAYYMVNYEWRSYFFQGALRYDHRYVKADASDEQFVDAGFVLPGEPESRTLTSNFSGLTGSLGVTRSLGKHQKLKANLSSGFRSPDLAELYSFGQHPGTSRFEIGNANFEREQSFQLDMNYALTVDRFRLDWSIFGSRIDNYIFFSDTGNTQPETDLQIWQYQQVEAQLYGSEINLQYVALENRQLKLNLGAALVRGENKDFDEPLTFIPPDNFNFKAAYGLGELQRTSIFSKLRHVARQDRPGFNEEETAGYTLLDFGIKHDFDFDDQNLEASLSVQNLLDKAYVDHLSILRAFNIPSPGRNITLNLRFYF